MPVAGGAICSLSSLERFDAIRELVRTSSAFASIKEQDAFVSEVIARENIQSTGIGRGVAIAHGKCDFIQEVHIGLGISAQGIDFASLDGAPVHLLFIIASSPRTQGSYLKALARIIAWMRDAELRDALRSLDLSAAPQRAAGTGTETEALIKLLESQAF